MPKYLYIVKFEIVIYYFQQLVGFKFLCKYVQIIWFQTFGFLKHLKQIFLKQCYLLSVISDKYFESEFILI